MSEIKVRKKKDLVEIYEVVKLLPDDNREVPIGWMTLTEEKARELFMKLRELFEKNSKRGCE